MLITVTLGNFRRKPFTVRAKMRRKWNPQLSIFHTMATHEIGKELAAISEVLDDNPEVVELAYKDLVLWSWPTRILWGLSALILAVKA